MSKASGTPSPIVAGGGWHRRVVRGQRGALIVRTWVFAIVGGAIPAVAPAWLFSAPGVAMIVTVISCGLVAWMVRRFRHLRMTEPVTEWVDDAPNVRPPGGPHSLY